ncbi:MAG: prepilin-type N-terminal cleavage/methylation domain-containing protein [Coriobacteriia bacterium]|nr:prepilin-type N-terminal cleavage/methylation domain-containing protein [Coriobacteriia bacterium]
MKRSRKSEGFTLVELMVVVLVIGILVAIAVPVFNAARSTAQQKTCFANQRTLEGAAINYSSQYGAYPAAGTVDATHPLIANGFVKAPPVCPLGGQQYAMDASGTVTLASLTCGHPHY